MSGSLNAPPSPGMGVSIPAAIFLTVTIFGCSLYANLSVAITNPADYRFFPPFQPYVNANENGHLGGEAFNIARAVADGKGYADPFNRPTGATAWMPPVLPTLLAGLLWLGNGSRDAVMHVVIFLQTFVLIGTGMLVVTLARQTTTRVSTWLTALLYVGALLANFRFCFQTTRDCWIVLLAVDLLIAGLCWLGPLGGLGRALGWGVFGGVCAQISPVVGLTWGLLSLGLGWRQRAWPALLVTLSAAGLTLLPWTARNHQVLGRWVPVKSNLAYELYQAQLLEPDGLSQSATIQLHPHSGHSEEALEYNALGEIAYLDHKRAQFLHALRTEPWAFVERVGCRFVGAAVWYVPFDRLNEPVNQPWTIWIHRIIHPLPFLALIYLALTALRRPLHRMQVTVIGVYALYLLPYIGASYMERYAIPLLGVKVLLLIWAIDRFLEPNRPILRQRVAAIEPQESAARSLRPEK
jgi:hypothetical protein